MFGWLFCACLVFCIIGFFFLFVCLFLVFFADHESCLRELRRSLDLEDTSHCTEKHEDQKASVEESDEDVRSDLRRSCWFLRRLSRKGRGERQTGRKGREGRKMNWKGNQNKCKEASPSSERIESRRNKYINESIKQQCSALRRTDLSFVEKKRRTEELCCGFIFHKRSQSR